MIELTQPTQSISKKLFLIENSHRLEIMPVTELFFN